MDNLEKKHELLSKYFNFKYYDENEIKSIVELTINLIKEKYDHYEKNHKTGALYVVLNLYKKYLIKFDDVKEINLVLKEFFLNIYKNYENYVDLSNVTTNQNNLDLKFYIIFLEKIFKKNKRI